MIRVTPAVLDELYHLRSSSIAATETYTEALETAAVIDVHHAQRHVA